MKNFEYIIIGTGQATGTLLGKLISTGKQIAVIEGAHIGGSCVNYGCTPTKTLVASARAVHISRRGNFYGVNTGEISVNYDRIRERMNEIRLGSRNGLRKWLQSTDNITLYEGFGTFVNENTIEIDGKNITGNTIFINVGTRQAKPPIKGLEEVPWLDSERLLELEELPEHLVIIGGGYIGMEYAQIYRRFGCKVTVIQRSSEVMPREDSDISQAIRNILEDEGVHILCNTEANEVTKEDDKIKVHISGTDKDTITGSHLLLAAGRRPNSDTLNLDAAGIKTNPYGFIKVDNYCRTNVENIFALGDVNGEGAFTHTSVNDAEIALDHLFGGHRKLSNRIPIHGLFIDPPLGKVGMTEKEALSQGKRVLKATRPMSKISRAKEMGETKGFAKLLVDAETDLILGAAVLGPGGDEIINMFAAIMHSRIPCKNYREVVLVHPTVSELMPFVLDGLKEIEQ